MRRFAITSAGAPGLIGKVFFSLFLSVFLLAGLFFEFMIGRDVWRDLRTYGWQKTECVITESRGASREELEFRGEPYRFVVKYRYTFGGREHQGDVYTRGYRGSSDYSKVQRLTGRYRPRAKAVCYVNPNQPAEAVLERKAPWLAFGLLFPLIFITIGGGGIYFIWRGGKSDAKDGESPDPSISREALKGKMAAVPGCFFLVFFLAGVGFAVPFFVLPAVRVLASGDWHETPCVVLSSNVRTHSGSDGATYSIDILYSYEIDGREYRANRYGFMGGSSSGYAGKAQIVKQHPPGAKTVCFVDPEDPTRAVLHRGFTLDFLFGLIPLVFVAVGAGGMVYWYRFRQRATRDGLDANWMPKRAPTVTEDAYSSAGWNTGPVTLKPTAPPCIKLLVTVFAAAFWNGIVSIFLVDVIKSWQRGRPNWFMTVFMVPFVVVGTGLISAVCYCFLALFNPRPILTVNSTSILLGSSIRLRWRLRGGLGNVRALTISLEGREEATYTRGTTTTTDQKTFCTIPVTHSNDLLGMHDGEAEVTVPPDTIHSFEADNNKIVWAFKVHADIPRWPDVEQEFPITVLPTPNQEGH